MNVSAPNKGGGGLKLSELLVWNLKRKSKDLGQVGNVAEIRMKTEGKEEREEESGLWGVLAATTRGMLVLMETGNL